MIKLLASLKNGQKCKKKILKKKLSSSILTVLKPLVKKNLIFLTNSNDARYTEIHLKYFNGKPLIKDINIISSSGSKIYLTFFQLNALFYLNNSKVILISSTAGIIDIDTALRLKIGGEIMAIITV